MATQYAVAPLPLRSEIELVAISIALAAILYYAIENPVRKSKWLANRRLVTFVFGAALIGLSFAAIYWHLSHH
jgi:peptidoglycan/LPS O-acetylase OafA/YrhL